MSEGPLGGPRPFSSPEGEIVVRFNFKLEPNEVEELRRSILTDEMPLIAYKIDRVVNSETAVFSMDGEAVTLNMLQDIKKTAEDATGIQVNSVEVQFR